MLKNHWQLIALILAVAGLAQAGAIPTPRRGPTKATIMVTSRAARSKTMAAEDLASHSVDVPVLQWQPRSDWLNVKRDLSPAAVGDGKTDDTDAIQNGLDRLKNNPALYFPPGTYRVTRTLVLNGPLTGSLITGCGRATRLEWDGPTGGVLFRSNGAAYSRYEGLTWDGRGRAAVGFDHASALRFETEVTHENEAFRNFTGYGIRVGNQQQIASAEILYENCLFERCGTGVAMLQFNDYNNTFDRCEFRECGIGVYDDHANFYARNCHFERSSDTDFSLQSEHGDSVRRCSSWGSRRFLVERGTIAPLTMEDCAVSGWTDPDGAVQLNGSPVLLFDCRFTHPPTNAPAVRLLKPAQKLLISGKGPATPGELVRLTPESQVYEIPLSDRRQPVAPVSSHQHFLRQTATTPGQIFDAVKQFGAHADGRNDDTGAVQAAINAARRAATGAEAYLPAGRYLISRTLEVRGQNYRVGGSGERTALIWRGPAGMPLVEVRSTRRVTLEHLSVGNADFGPMAHGDDILVQAPDGRPLSLVLDEVYAFGMYQKAPEQHGIHFVDLPPQSLVDALHVQGNLKIENCASATLLFRTSYEGTVTIWGRKCPATGGITGFLTRLDTLAGPTLHVRDSQSVVMSDFYDEQSLSHLLLEGNAGDSPGAVTIEGPKTHLTTQAPVIQLRGFHGRVFYGEDEFYDEPKKPHVEARGSPTDLNIVGCFFYNTHPVFELGRAAHLTLLANEGISDTRVSRQALMSIAAALDDLRCLGLSDQISTPWPRPNAS